MSRVKLCYALSLAYSAIVLIIFGILLTNTSMSVRSHGTNKETTVVIVVLSCILAGYFIGLALAIKVYLLVTGLYTGQPIQELSAGMSRPSFTKHPITFVPAENQSSVPSDDLQKWSAPDKA